ncbi:MAG: SSU ribosomal protein S19p (S15e), partial [uncultured Solirubrobacteraceae bacterium]
EPFIQEGAVGRGAPHGPHRRPEHREHAHHDQDLVARVHDLPGDGRAHDRRPRRPQARARLRLGVHGRPQARRVRADAPVPRPSGERQGPM